MEKDKNNPRTILALLIFSGVFFVFSENVFAEGRDIMINEIYATGSDDWIELYNFSSEDVDLSDNYRLYKSVSSSPILLMRFGNLSDGSYPKGTTIESHGYYLIVRDDASADLLGMADAICSKSSFTWDGSGYTIYLGGGPISGNDDADIIDMVGFGRESGSAPAIADKKSIGRLGSDDTDDDSADFSLQNPTFGTENIEMIVEEDVPEEDGSEAEAGGLGLSAEIRQDEKIYPKIYAAFDAEISDADGNKLKLDRMGKKYEYACSANGKQCAFPTLKFTWNFGDNHKSYLLSTKHKYEKTGTYVASLTAYDPAGKKKTVKNFSVSVGDVPHPKVKIVAVNPNPEGKDSENETITLENKSKKRLNLKGWSIATGWKKLINHPITEDFFIKAGKKKEITRESSKFTLNNKKAKIELRYPDGEVADDVKYKKKEKSVAEDETYEKRKKGWAWRSQETVNKKQETAKNVENVSSINTKSNTKTEMQYISGSILDAGNEKETVVAGNRENNKRNDIEFLQNKKVEIGKIEFEPEVLGAETVREIGGQYHFTPEYPEPKHYAIVFFENISSDLNTSLNLLLNRFFGKNKRAQGNGCSSLGLLFATSEAWKEFSAYACFQFHTFWHTHICS